MIGGKIGMPEILILLAIILVIFGPSKLPQLAKSIGQSVTELKDGLQKKPEEDREKETEVETTSGTDTKE